MKASIGPSVDFLNWNALELLTFIITQAKELIEQAGLSGLEFKANRRLFAGR